MFVSVSIFQRYRTVEVLTLLPRHMTYQHNIDLRHEIERIACIQFNMIFLLNCGVDSIIENRAASIFVKKNMDLDYAVLMQILKY